MRRPLVGAVSMDNITVDLGPSTDVEVGAAATLIGSDGNEHQSAEAVAGRIGTINYEVICGISKRVPRRYHRDGIDRTERGATRLMSVPLDLLATLTERAWLVGGAVRDDLLGRVSTDFDVVLPGDAAPVARDLSRRAGAHVFALSDTFGAWRVVARDHAWQIDLMPIIGDSICGCSGAA